jgi:hypothetical protein
MSMLISVSAFHDILNNLIDRAYQGNHGDHYHSPSFNPYQSPGQAGQRHHTFGPNHPQFNAFPQNFPMNQPMPPHNYMMGNPMSSLDSQNTGSNGFNNINNNNNNLNHPRSPITNYQKPPHMQNINSNNFSPGNTSPLNDHHIDIQGLGNYPDEWMYAMPDPGHYVEVPMNLDPTMGPPHFNESPIMGSPGHGQIPPDVVYDGMGSGIPLDPSMPVEMVPGHGIPVHVVGGDAQSIHSMVPNMYVGQYQDDCLYMNLEEEYLHKVSLQNKNDNEMANVQHQKN